MGGLLRVAALVLFILAALALFGAIGSWTTRTDLGLIAAGLACATAAAFPLPAIPER
jgi:hypothetical protein